MRKSLAITLLQVLVLLLLFVLNLLLGTVRIPVGSVCAILLGSGEENEIWTNIVLSSRVPQALTAMVAGAGLAVSGLQMQTVFHNPLAGPRWVWPSWYSCRGRWGEWRSADLAIWAMWRCR